MTSIAPWPAALPYQPIMDGYVFQPGDTHLATPMEQGERVRPRFGVAPAHVELVWPFALTAFELFRTWYRYSLQDGALHFRMPVWNGGAWQDSLCRFRRMYEPRLQGLEWFVSAELHARPYAVALHPEEA